MTEFTLPEVGENVEQGDLVRLLVSPGSRIKEGEAVMELETDKAVIEVTASASGTVKDIRVKEGDKIKVGQVIFTFENGTNGNARPSSPESTFPAVTPQPASGETNFAPHSAPSGRRSETPSPASTSSSENPQVPPPRTGREYIAGRLSSLDGSARRFGLRRPACDGT